jgi:hypothetical protein
MGVNMNKEWFYKLLSIPAAVIVWIMALCGHKFPEDPNKVND